ncbi:MAG: toxin-antitoxin system YwqK family antitoxin [Flavobacteriales bacterium]
MKYLGILFVILCSVGCQKKIETLTKEHYKNGAEKLTITYMGDTTHLVSATTFYPSGKLFMKVVYQENGSLPLSEEYFYENGEIKQVGTYMGEQRAGTWKAFFPTGQLQSMRNYNDQGKEEGIYEVYKLEGDYYYPYIRGFFSNGEKRGTWKFFNRDGDTIKTVNH